MVCKISNDLDEIISLPEETIDLLKQQAETIQYFFSKGEKVFHEHLGFGEILDVIEVGDSLMYTIDFGKFGKKAMDANYARLKKV